MQWPGAEMCREGVVPPKEWFHQRRLAERVTAVAWDDCTNGSASFDVSFFLIRWSSARFAF